VIKELDYFNSLIFNTKRILSNKLKNNESLDKQKEQLFDEFKKLKIEYKSSNIKEIISQLKSLYFFRKYKNLIEFYKEYEKKILFLFGTKNKINIQKNIQKDILKYQNLSNKQEKIFLNLTKGEK
jgi:hypothetical protein